MDEMIDAIAQMIGTVGFPIVACAALFWMVNSNMKELTTAITLLTKSIEKSMDNKED